MRFGNYMAPVSVSLRSPAASLFVVFVLLMSGGNLGSRSPRIARPQLRVPPAGEPGNWFFDQRAYPLGYIPDGAHEKAIARRVEMEAGARKVFSLSAAEDGSRWQFIGPQPIQGCLGFGSSNAGPGMTVSGHIEALVMDPRNPQVIYAGASGGGVWKTTDGGKQWQPLTDSQPALDISALALDSSNPDIVYAATGFYYKTPGLLKSTDSGKTWQSLPAPKAGVFQSVR